MSTLKLKACSSARHFSHALDSLLRLKSAKLLHSVSYSSSGMAAPAGSWLFSIQAEAEEAATEQAVKRARRDLEDANNVYNAAATHYSEAARDYERCAATRASTAVRSV
jgi:hypothetical protein